jgi:hypothetical protein
MHAQKEQLRIGIFHLHLKGHDLELEGMSWRTNQIWWIEVLSTSLCLGEDSANPARVYVIDRS